VGRRVKQWEAHEDLPRPFGSHVFQGGFTICWQSVRWNVRVSPRRDITADTILGNCKPELTFWTEEKGLEEIA